MRKTRFKNAFYLNVHVEQTLKGTTQWIWDCEISCNVQTCHLWAGRNDVLNSSLPGAVYKY